MNSTGNAFNRNPNRIHAPRHKSKGPVRDGPRSFLSAGSIRYERTLGRLKAAARDKGIHPDTVVMGGKATFAKWLCDTCGQQCVTSMDYQNHLTSQRHIEAIEEFSDGEILEMQSKLLEDAFLARLRSARTVSTKATILYEDIQNSAKKATLEDTKWANEADPLTAFVEDMERQGKMTLVREENGIYLKYRPPTAPPVKVAPLQYTDEELVARQIRLANAAQDKSVAVQADLLERQEGAPKISFALGKKVNPKLGVHGEASAPLPTEQEQEVSEDEHRVRKKSRLEADESGDNSESRGGDANDEDDNSSNSHNRSNNCSGSNESRKSISSRSRSTERSSSGAKSNESSSGKPSKNDKSSRIVFKTGPENMKSTVTAHCWLTRKLTVKCMCKATKSVGYYKQKGEIVDVHDYWKTDGTPSADLRMADGVILAKVPMRDLETVLPALGRTVLIVSSLDELIRGQEAELLTIDQHAFSCSVRVLSGNRVGTRIVGLAYESVCKIT